MSDMDEKGLWAAAAELAGPQYGYDFDGFRGLRNQFVNGLEGIRTAQERDAVGLGNEGVQADFMEKAASVPDLATYRNNLQETAATCLALFEATFIKKEE